MPVNNAKVRIKNISFFELVFPLFAADISIISILVLSIKYDLSSRMLMGEI
jgi:hypothetical protein